MSPIRQAYDRHVAALEARDLDAVVAGYASDAVLVATDRIVAGHDAIRAVFAGALDAAMDLEPETMVLEQGDVIFVSWHAGQQGADVVGADTFVIIDGLITVHTGFISGPRT